MTERERSCATCGSHPDPRYRQFVNGIGIGHDAQAHRIMNFLWWGGVRDVSQFHDMDEHDLRAVPRIADAGVRLILERREYPGNAKNPVGVLRHAAAIAETMREPWARALADAFRAAAENHVYCRRTNLRHPGQVPEIPDPASEELATVARLLVDRTQANRDDMEDSECLKAP